MFQRIVETAPGNRTLTEEDRRQLALLEMPEYSVTVHSGPSDHPVTEVKIGLDKKLPPWVITFDNFLTEEECDAMIQHGFDTGYKRSEDVGSQKFDGTVESKKSKGRTSENAWCSTRNGCREKTVPKRILHRLSTVIGIPSENSEDFQILKYDVGQCTYCTHFNLWDLFWQDLWSFNLIVSFLKFSLFCNAWFRITANRIRKKVYNVRKNLSKLLHVSSYSFRVHVISWTIFQSCGFVDTSRLYTSSKRQTVWS